MNHLKPYQEFADAVQGVTPEQSRAALFKNSPQTPKTMVEQTEPVPELRPCGMGEETVNMQVYNQKLHEEKMRSSVRRVYQTQTIETRTRIYQFGELVSDTVEREVRDIQNRHQATNAFNRNAEQVWFEHQKTSHCFPNYSY